MTGRLVQSSIAVLVFLVGCSAELQLLAPMPDGIEETLTTTQIAETSSPSPTVASPSAFHSPSPTVADPTPIRPSKSCKEIMDRGLSEGDGNYQIAPYLNGNLYPTIDVVCDMTTDGGGWTAISFPLANGVFEGELRVIDEAAIQSIDPEHGPYSQDGKGDHTLWYTFDVPFAYDSFYLSQDYQAKANSEEGYESDIKSSKNTFEMSDWSMAFLPSSEGDIAFGNPSLPGPTTSWARYLDAEDGTAVKCENCVFNWPSPGEIYTPDEPGVAFRIAFGEGGTEPEGWYAWWAGSIYYR